MNLRRAGVLPNVPPLPPLLFLFTAHAAFYFFALGRDAVDDAYISFRYAQNAILGYGLVFNPGERVEGFTNFLWTALMVPLEGAGVDVGRASMVLGLLFGMAVLWWVLRFARIAHLPGGAGWLAALLLAVDGSFALWSVSGLETALFGFLVFAGILSYIREQAADTWPLSGILFALAAMTRPEGLLVFGLTVVHQAAWRVLAERRLWVARDLARVIVFGALFAPYWTGRWQYYHSFLPNSFHAKVSVTGPEAQLIRGWNHLAQFVSVHLGWVILLPAAVAVVRAPVALIRSRGSRPDPQARRRLFWTTYLAAILIPYAGYIVYVGGDWSVGRFFLPLLPPFYLLFSTGLVDMWNWAAEKWGRSGKPAPTFNSRPSGGVAAALTLAGLVWLFSSWNGEYGIFIHNFDAATATAAREAMGKWLHASAPKGTLIAVDAAGQVPYYSGLPAIDMFGINDLHIGRLPVSTLGQGTPGHEKFDLVYVVGRSPQYVVIYGTLLDGVREYERAPVEWTDNPEYVKFLTLYRRKE